MSTSPIRYFDRAALKQLREDRGLSLAKLAAQSTISPATIRHWESGLYAPSIESLSLVMDALGVNITAVLPIPMGVATLMDLRVLAMVPSSDAAEAVGLTRSGWSALERGEVALSDERAELLAELFEVEPQDVLDAWRRSRDAQQ